MTPSTVRNYVGVASCVPVVARGGGGWARSLGGWTAAAVSAFVLVEAQRSSGRFCEVLGHEAAGAVAVLAPGGRDSPHDLTGAVPSVASWRLASLVKALDSRSLARLLPQLRSAHASRAPRPRDHHPAVAVGVACVRGHSCFQLADIDWRSGELLVRGKGNRQERLPLPADVGEALAGWLARGRPPLRARHPCSCAFALRWAACRRVLVSQIVQSRLPAGGAAGGERSSFAGTRPRPRCSGPAGA